MSTFDESEEFQGIEGCKKLLRIMEYSGIDEMFDDDLKQLIQGNKEELIRWAIKRWNFCTEPPEVTVEFLATTLYNNGITSTKDEAMMFVKGDDGLSYKQHVDLTVLLLFYTCTLNSDNAKSLESPSTSRGNISLSDSCLTLPKFDEFVGIDGLIKLFRNVGYPGINEVSDDDILRLIDEKNRLKMVEWMVKRWGFYPVPSGVTVEFLATALCNIGINSSIDEATQFIKGDETVPFDEQISLISRLLFFTYMLNSDQENIPPQSSTTTLSTQDIINWYSQPTFNLTELEQSSVEVKQDIQEFETTPGPIATASASNEMDIESDVILNTIADIDTQIHKLRINANLPKENTTDTFDGNKLEPVVNELSAEIAPLNKMGSNVSVCAQTSEKICDNLPPLSTMDTIKSLVDLSRNVLKTMTDGGT